MEVYWRINLIMNILILSCGTRNELVQFFKDNLNKIGGRVITVDCSKYAPALYEGNEYYIVPNMTEANYLPTILDICKNNFIDIILPLQEDELKLISSNKPIFKNENIQILVSCEETIDLCRDKYSLYQKFKECGIPTILTANSMIDFVEFEKQGLMNFPVFVKPRTGCGSIGAMRVETYGLLKELCSIDNKLIIQNCIDGEEYGVDAYIDTILNN